MVQHKDVMGVPIEVGDTVHFAFRRGLHTFFQPRTVIEANEWSVYLEGDGSTGSFGRTSKFHHIIVTKKGPNGVQI
jgi:hypothetical protein